MEQHTGTYRVQCPNNEDHGDFSSIALHWQSSRCEYPEISDNVLELITGTLLGDGSIIDPDNSNNCYFKVDISNPSFVWWMDEQLGYLSNGVKIGKSKESCDKSLANQGYEDADSAPSLRVSTFSHPKFNELRNRYYRYSKEEDKYIKFYPKDEKLTPLKLAMWWASDGQLNWSDCKNPQASMKFHNHTQQDKPEKVINMFDSIDIPANWHTDGINVKQGDVAKCFSYMKEVAPPGYEYKWAHNEKVRYQALKGLQPSHQFNKKKA